MKKLTLDKFPSRVLASIDIERAFIVSRLVIAAERMQLFRTLHGRRLPLAAIGRKVKIHPLYLKPFLDAMTGLGLLRRNKDLYCNASFAEKYFIEERSIFWTRQYSKECVDAYDALTLLEKTLTNGKRYVSAKGLKKLGYVERMKRDRREAEDFTQMLYYLHREDAEALASYLDLSQHRAVLDVGGGSGVMSIALAKRNLHLRGCVLDVAPVCAVAAANIRKAGLARRVCTLAGDIRQPLPLGYDVILFCDIGPVSEELLKNAYDCLMPDGVVVLADRYMSEDGTRPFDRLLHHFVGSGFGLATHRHMAQSVKACGFRAVKAKNLYRDVWYITGRK